MAMIPVDVIPAHIYLSAEDQEVLFGLGHPMTIAQSHTHKGQVVYREMVEIFGRLKRSLKVHVLGPNWARSHAEVSPTEAVYLGYSLDEVQKGSLGQAAPCTIKGPVGEVELDKGLIVPKPHLTLNLDDAESLGLHQGSVTQVSLQVDDPVTLDDVLVRVHPSFQRRLELHQDYARELWLARQTYAKVIH